MNIFFVGLSGVPYTKRACDTRLLSFANIFTSKKHKVTILNRLPEIDNSEKKNENFSTDIKIIELFTRKKPKSLVGTILCRFISYPKELFLLYNLNKRDHIDILHLYSGHYFEFVHYYVISKIIKAKIVYQYVEVRSEIERESLYHKINGALCDKFGSKLFDGVISISNYIDNLVAFHSPLIPRIKVPPICETKYFDSIKVPSVSVPYILFCGSAYYHEVINLIINSYKLSKATKDFKLILVLSGPEKSMKNILVNAKDNIEILSGLLYDDLIRYYLGASALLIPLRNTIQDKARFPNKICEYTACKGLIVTNNVGEIPYYFTDGKDALIASDFSSEALIEKLNLVVAMSSEEIYRIKDKSHQLCYSFFDNSVYSTDLDLFLKKVVKDKN